MATFKTRETLVDQFITELRKAMDASGISASELARRAGVGRPYLHRVLSGDQNPSLDWVERVAKVLGMTVTIKRQKKYSKSA